MSKENVTFQLAPNKRAALNAIAVGMERNFTYN